jgi:hypothetical protein
MKYPRHVLPTFHCTQKEIVFLVRIAQKLIPLARTISPLGVWAYSPNHQRRKIRYLFEYRKQGSHHTTDHPQLLDGVGDWEGWIENQSDPED